MHLLGEIRNKQFQDTFLQVITMVGSDRSQVELAGDESCAVVLARDCKVIFNS